MPDTVCISVVIGTFNLKEKLLKVLASLVNQTMDPCNFEVIVVDSGSADGTIDSLETLTTPYSLRWF